MAYIPKRPKRKAKPWGKNQKLYSSHRWRMERLEYLSCHPVCMHKGCDRTATVRDHRIPIEQGGDVWAWKNAQALCTSHHNSKTARESNK